MANISETIIATMNIGEQNDTALTKPVSNEAFPHHEELPVINQPTEFYPGQVKLGFVKEIPDDIARTLWAICTLSKFKITAEPPFE